MLYILELDKSYNKLDITLHLFLRYLFVNIVTNYKHLRSRLQQAIFSTANIVIAFNALIHMQAI